ncbi:hypothetical protein ONE63_006936 [Megalurothrips usitatus]|uniref:MD-2-related lipid-recognition domain-containing protein n=1 Tax=Megalurothrips usitatus TaxID=439358 RepID=A0AAV7XQG3_9NEOP|nr:hypothetical protein ONE63_006936 [Megalurothrips usitatus]
MRGQERVASADFELSRPSRSFQRVEFKIVRCPDAISYNTCEYFDTWKFSIGICPMMTNPGMPWNPWVRAIKPTFRCPIKAGNYSFRDVGIAASALSQFGVPLENNWYIVTLRLFDPDGLEYVCVNYTATFKRVRS